MRYFSWKDHAMANNDNSIHIPDENLATYAGHIALEIRPDGTGSGASAARLLRRSLRAVELAAGDAAEKWQGQAQLPGAVRWLLDNQYLARREGLAACGGLRGRRRLRRCGGNFAVFLTARGFLRSGGFGLSEERLRIFLTGFQKVLMLSGEELRLLPDALRWALISELAEGCSRMDKDENGELENLFSSIFASLRLLSAVDLFPVIEDCDLTEQLLRRDPAGIYPLMDEDSRAYYRRRLSLLCRGRPGGEYAGAQAVLRLAKNGAGRENHIGFWILERPLGSRPVRRTGGLYIGSFIIVSVFLSLLPAFISDSFWAAVLLLVPVSELIKAFMDLVLSRLAPARPLPGLELRDGIPAEGCTLCAVSCIISGEKQAAALAQRLEEHMLCSRDAGRELIFALIADLPDTGSEALPESGSWLRAAENAINALNARYGGGFCLLTRPRTQSAGGRWMGWERKRGALLETMRLIKGMPSGMRCAAGNPADLKRVRFLLSLDSDTRLSPGAVRRLAGIMLHPLNRPVCDDRRRVVRRGHGIISPRIGIELASSVKSDFARAFAGQGGRDPYSGVCRELYMDMWASGGFAGKGLIDIDAYLFCMDSRIEPGRVLSHDALEGAFLRGGLTGSCQLMDSFPATPLSYYKRLHRWIRGDWQNLPWLFSRGRALPEIERFRLFDSLRRSLVPVMSFAAIYSGFFLRQAGFVIAACAALSACLSQLLISMAQGLFLSEEDAALRLHSSTLHGLGGSLVRSALYLILLPIEAFFSLDAIVRSLWRMLISHKNLLQWQTAGQSDALGCGPLKCLLSMWPACLAGLAALFFAPHIIGRAAGLIWALSPLCAYILGLPSEDTVRISVSGREQLLSWTGAMWKYFDKFMSPAGHFLPPDNFQSQPPKGLAMRSSPTNIGLALLSCMSALDLGLCDKSRCMYLIESCLDTLEKLEKWHGHICNWYDIETLRPLRPAYISTVDSGNLCACLCALETGLSEHDRPDLAARARELQQAMDFTPLYDSRRRLFHTGYDLEKRELSASWYDLMSSEARLTGYTAIARGDIGFRHWERLSRARVEKNGYRGMVSWTGTMFEYLMPELLLPLCRDSLLYESARFCLYVQKLRGRKLSAPWGISESAYFSLDSAMNYRYKAHGAAALALKRGMDDEAVISPYSSFLALCLSPNSAVRNLKRLERLGLGCTFGFWEALDLTPGREGTVRCVMAHHLGMSICAAANCLLGGLWQQRFMKRPEMRAFELLLQEKVPLGGPVLRRRCRDVPSAQRPSFDARWSDSGEGADVLEPRCCLLSGMSYSLMLSESGLYRALWGALSVCVPPSGRLDCGGTGLFFSQNGEEYSLLPRPCGSGPYRKWRFTPETAEFFCRGESFSSLVTVFIPENAAGERRDLSLHCSSPGQLRLSIAPLLARARDYFDHPAFWRLGLSFRLCRGCLIVRRLPRGGCPELFLCFACDRPGSFQLAAGPRGKARRIDETELFPAALEAEWLCPVDSGDFSCRFALCVGHSPEEALDAAEAALAAGPARAASAPRRAAAVLGISPQGFGGAWSLIGPLFFPPPPLQSHRQDELWRFGISGDLPIVCADFRDEKELPGARRLMDSHLLICAGGGDFDLVFISHDPNGYHKPLRSMIDELLWKNGGDLLAGARGGVHIIEAGDGAQAVIDCAALRIDLSLPLPRQQRSTRFALPEGSRTLPRFSEKPVYFWNDDFSFSLVTRGELPPRVWSDVLTNGRMGYLACDSGCGSMWYLNSREMQLSPWLGLDNVINGPETLFIERDGQLFSLFAGMDEHPCRVDMDFGVCTWSRELGNMKTRVSAFIPPGTDVRVFLIELSGCGDSRLHWKLGISLSQRRFARISFDGGLFRAESPRFPGPGFLAAFSVPPLGFTGDGARAAVFDYTGAQGFFREPVFAAAFRGQAKLVIACGCCGEDELRRLTLPENAEKALSGCRAFWKEKLSYFSMESSCPELDRIMNGWISYQALACRLMARCGLYQSGGAFGFRDQLQDSVNLMLMDPEPARRQILRCCSRQYTEGDVQHWWHETPQGSRGVRTRCSDDLIWLPWALCEYTGFTGDLSLAGEKAPYLNSQPLDDSERDRYEDAPASEFSESVLLHCRRALDAVIRRGTGPHGLLRFGSGDWNDGFDSVGGESQWLSWFFINTALSFAGLMSRLDMDGSRYEEAARKLYAACSRAWDGKWYLRGYFENGMELGGSRCSACRIDSIAQSFAAFCPLADPERVDMALSSAVEQLFSREHGLIRLFTPPFSGEAPCPGYIESYGPGFRENGGQYTHAALWLIMALLRRGRRDEAWELLRAVLPSEKPVNVYRAEPYVLAADVWDAPGHRGEAGWSWYTGSAGWLLTLVTRELLGLRVQNGRLRIAPSLPSGLPFCLIRLRGHTIELRDGGIKLDGTPYHGGEVELK